jgi:hypothetical protein
MTTWHFNPHGPFTLCSICCGTLLLRYFDPGDVLLLHHFIPWCLILWHFIPVTFYYCNFSPKHFTIVTFFFSPYMKCQTNWHPPRFSGGHHVTVLHNCTIEGPRRNSSSESPSHGLFLTCGGGNIFRYMESYGTYIIFNACVVKLMKY